MKFALASAILASTLAMNASAESTGQKNKTDRHPAYKKTQPLLPAESASAGVDSSERYLTTHIPPIIPHPDRWRDAMTPYEATRRFILRLGVAGGAAGYLRRVLASGTHPAAPGFYRVSGEVRVNGHRAGEGGRVGPGDTVVTGPDVEAIYVIGDNAFLQRGSTTVQFASDVAKDFMRVVSGRILSVFGRGDKRLVVRTAVIGIRGTACYIEDEGTRTYFCLCYGMAEVVPSAAPQEREILRTEHHDHPIYIHSDPRMPKSMVLATVKNHTDAELTLLEGLVGRIPPFLGKSLGGAYGGAPSE